MVADAAVPDRAQATEFEWGRRHDHASYSPDSDTPPPPPPGGPALTPSPDDDDEPIGGPTRAESELAVSVLDAEYAVVDEQLTDDGRRVIHEWQRDDRTYDEFQKAVRGKSDDPHMTEQADILDELVRRHRLNQPVRAYRGIRDARKVFGLTNNDLADLRDRRIELPGFFGTSVDREVAIAKFTRPPLGGGPVLIEVLIPAGTRALWVALSGDPTMKYQRELLLPSRVAFTVTDVDTAAELPAIHVTVLAH